MDITAIYGLFFRLLYPIVMVVTGIILYIILSGKDKPTLLGLAFIIYGLIDAAAASMFFFALMNIPVSARSGWSPGSYIAMMNFISSIISLAALVVFVVLVIIGVNKILESERNATAPHTIPTK